MKVSVVIPVYNGQKYVRETIDSVINQTYKDIEIIVVNDGSTDYTLDILKSYEDRIKIINKINRGTASALNTGINEMIGEWFKWVSADDVLFPDAIESLMNEVKTLGDKAYDCILYTNYDIIDENGNFIKEFIEPNYNRMPSFERNVILLDNYYGNGSSSLIHKNIFKRIGKFDEKLGNREDYEFWLRACVLNGCMLHLVFKKTVKYRVHQDQLTRKTTAGAFRKTQQIRQHILNQLTIDQKESYLKALKIYQKKPISITIRRKVRNIMIKIFPDRITNFIIKKYMEQK